MRKVIAAVLCFFASLVFCGSSVASQCFSDLDCELDQRCLKQDASENSGVCVKAGPSGKGSYIPSFSPSPPPSQLKEPPKRGKFCMSNTDCGPGESCVRKGSDAFGACY